MSQFALKFVHRSPEKDRSLRFITGGRATSSASVQFIPGLISREILPLAVILVALQILDGVLTGIGMVSFGTSMEGNILLRSLMVTIGAIPALIVVKGGSIALIAYLCSQAQQVRWLKPAFYAVIGIYLAFAIFPWTYILFDTLLA